MAIPRVSLICGMLILFSSLLLANVATAVTMGDGHEGDLLPGDLGVGVYVDPHWIVNGVGEFGGYDSITVLHIQVFNDNAEDVIISPREGFRLLRHMPGDSGEGVTLIGPTSTRVWREPPTDRVLEVSSAESAVFTGIGDAPRQRGFLLAQSMISGHNPNPTGEGVLWRLPPGESHHFSAVIAGKTGITDLFTLELMVSVKDEQVGVPTGLHVAVIDGTVHAYVD